MLSSVVVKNSYNDVENTVWHAYPGGPCMYQCFPHTGERPWWISRVKRVYGTNMSSSGIGRGGEGIRAGNDTAAGKPETEG